MKLIVLALLGVNLGLAAYFGFLFLHRGAAPVSPLPGELAVSPPTPAPQSSPPPALAPRSSKRTAGRFDWQSLATSDLKQYVANLRAAQCPAETIRDIIAAEVNRQFAPREQAFKVRPEDYQPWESVPTMVRRGNEGRLREVLMEKRALLRDLLGIDVPVEMPAALAGRATEKFEQAFNELPESKRDLARSVQEKYWLQSDDIKRRTLGFLEPEDRDEFKRIKAERRAELAKVLTTQELEDFDIKTSSTTTMLKSQMAGFNATDEEFRKIFRLTHPLDEEYSLGRGTRDPEDEAGNAKRKEIERELQNQVRAALGEERFAEMERTRDPAYRAVSQAGEEFGLPAETVLKTYEMQKLVREEVLRTQRDPNLSPEQRAGALEAMRLEAEKSLRTLVGDRAPELIKRLENPAATRTRIQVGDALVFPGPASGVPVPVNPIEIIK